MNTIYCIHFLPTSQTLYMDRKPTETDLQSISMHHKWHLNEDDQYTWEEIKEQIMISSHNIIDPNNIK